jgi:hypothetical protein
LDRRRLNALVAHEHGDGIWPSSADWYRGDTTSMAQWDLVCQVVTGSEWVRILAAGVLGGVVNASLDIRGVVLPRVRAGRLELGAAGPLIASVAAAYFVDHGFHTAFLGALCGVSAIRHIRARVQAAFRAELDALEEEGSGHGA